MDSDLSRRLAALAFVIASASTAAAQASPHFVTGYASVMFDALPDVADADGRQDVHELRARVFVERRQELGAHVRLMMSGYVDGLVAHRETTPPAGTIRDVVVRPMDLHVDATWPAVDL